MLKSGMTFGEAMEYIGAKRHIYGGHFLEHSLWPAHERDGKHPREFLQAQAFVKNLEKVRRGRSSGSTQAVAGGLQPEAVASERQAESGQKAPRQNVQEEDVDHWEKANECSWRYKDSGLEIMRKYGRDKIQSEHGLRMILPYADPLVNLPAETKINEILDIAEASASSSQTDLPRLPPELQENLDRRVRRPQQVELLDGIIAHRNGDITSDWALREIRADLQARYEAAHHDIDDKI